MIVETSRYAADEDKCIYPNAADSRKFLSDPDQGEPLQTVKTNLTISNEVYEKVWTKWNLLAATCRTLNSKSFLSIKNASLV